MSKLINEIELSSSIKNKALYMALLMGAGSLVLFIMFKQIPGLPIGMTILFIIIWLFSQNIKAFKFFEKHFVFQIAIIGKKLVAYSGLKSYTHVEKNIIIRYQNPNEKEKTLKFAVTAIESSQLSLLEKTIKSKIE